MIQVQADLHNQRLYITIDCALSKDELEQVIQAVTAEASKLAPGWAAAVDLRGIWVQDPCFHEHMRALQEAILAGGAGKVATLLDSIAVHMQLGQAGTQSHVNPITWRFYCQRDWEAFLAE